MEEDPWRLRAQTAMHEQGTLLEIVRIILAFAADIDDLTREICREIYERHHYEYCALYLSRGDSDPLIQANGGRLGGNLTAREAGALASETIANPQARTARTGDSWRVAVPIEDGSTTLGAIIAGSVGSDADAERALAVCKGLSKLIAIGVQNSEIRTLKSELAAVQQREQSPT